MADLTATAQHYEALARDRILVEIYRSLYLPARSTTTLVGSRSSSPKWIYGLESPSVPEGKVVSLTSWDFGNDSKWRECQFVDSSSAFPSLQELAVVSLWKTCDWEELLPAGVATPANGTLRKLHVQVNATDLISTPSPSYTHFGKLARDLVTIAPALTELNVEVHLWDFPDDTDEGPRRRRLTTEFLDALLQAAAITDGRGASGIAFNVQFVSWSDDPNGCVQSLREICQGRDTETVEMVAGIRRLASKLV